VKLKQRPEDFVVREGYRFEDDPGGDVWVYRLDKQKLSTLQALERIGKEFGVRRRALSVAGLKDKQGRTEQLVGVHGGSLGAAGVVQAGDMRLTLLGRTAQPISAANITANRFEVTVRDLSRDEASRVAESVREVERVGVVNYFDSQRFGFLKHGQGFIGHKLCRGDWEGALRAFLATPSELDKSDDAVVKRFWAEHWGQWQLREPHDAAKRYAPILRRLRQDPRDFMGAFLHIERRTRMMALFELQSFLWNEGVRRYLLGRVPSAELIGLRYQAGALLFPRALPAEEPSSARRRAQREGAEHGEEPSFAWRRAQREGAEHGEERQRLLAKTFPLLAHDSTFTDSQIAAAALAAVRAQGLTLAELRVPGTTALFFKHEERPLFVMPGKLRANEPRQDELNRGRLKVNLSFTLPPGAYATLVVRRLLWFAAEGSREMGAERIAAPARRGPAGRRPAWGRPLEPSPIAEDEERHEEAGATGREPHGVVDLAKRAAQGERAPPAPPRSRHEERKATGFLARQREKKAAKAERKQKR
jgi:tRNA pseudouridine13 synthase